MDWSKINCRECGKCNKKGKPSVSKGSRFCEKQRGLLAPERKSAWASFASKLQMMFQEKGFMRRAGPPKKKKEEEDEKTERNT